MGPGRNRTTAITAIFVVSAPSAFLAQLTRDQTPGVMQMIDEVRSQMKKLTIRGRDCFRRRVLHLSEIRVH